MSFGIFAVLVVAFTSIEGGAAERPASQGEWWSEDEYPAEIRPNEPSRLTSIWDRDGSVP
jgi:hypothetical protein